MKPMTHGLNVKVISNFGPDYHNLLANIYKRPAVKITIFLFKLCKSS